MEIPDYSGCLVVLFILALIGIVGLVYFIWQAVVWIGTHVSIT